MSLWSYINSNREQYVNADYTEYDGSLIKVDTTVSFLKIWSDYYFEFKDLNDAPPSSSSFRYTVDGGGGSLSPGGGLSNGGVGGASSSSPGVLQDGIDMLQSYAGPTAGNVTSRIASGIFTSGYKIFNTVKSTLRN